MNMNIENESKKKPINYSMLFGVLAGLGFAMGTWAVEGIALLSANGMFPFAKLLVGLVCCTLVGLLVGWLTKMFTSVLANVIIWGLFAAVLNQIALYIFFPGMKILLGWLDPEVQSMVDYSLDYGVKTRGTLMLIIMVVFGLIIGLLVNSFIEEASTATYPFRMWMTIILWIAIFLGVGILGDSLNQKPMREAVLLVNNAIQFQLEHEGEDLPVSVQVQMGLTGLRPVVEYLHSPRRMIPSDYDQMLILIKVLVKFDQDYAVCSVINNQMGTCLLVK